MIILVWAQDLNGGIGKNNKLPWHIREEMLHFKSITTGNVIVMGRKTFESIGKPLANRINIVLTRDLKFKVNGVVIYHDINKLIEDFINKDIYVIGGKQIYEAFKKYADMYIISYINSVYDCDTFMDNMNINNFKLLKEDNSHNDFKVKWYTK